MKELGIEQKAKAYDEAIKRAKELLEIGVKDTRDKRVVLSFFPELKESEGEQSKNWILEYLYDGLRKSDEQFKDHFKCAIAWLEKQGEQKSTDKVESKFKIGDWVVVDGVTQQVIQVRPDGFDTDRAWNGKLTFNDVHLWTIQDAKCGDILVDDLGNICIYQEPSTKLMYHSFCYGNHKCFIDVEGSHKIVGTCPATKEQSNLLFQKMNEAGYEWDADKKELKKIEQKPWSEEDEAIYYGVIETEQYMLDVVNGIKKFNVGNISIKEECTRELNWLKSLKDRVLPQPKQEWSEEDKETINNLIDYLENEDDSSYTDLDKESFAKEIKLLKSLRLQNRWKPSDYELEVLKLAAEKDGTCLMGLYEQLKKLREE